MGRSCHWGMYVISNLFLIRLSCNLGCMFFCQMWSWYIDTIKRTKITHRRTHQRGRFGGLNQSPLLDYCELSAEFKRAFNTSVSVEILEVSSFLKHKGSRLIYIVACLRGKHYNTYSKLVDFALKSKDGTVLVTSSTFPESRFLNHQYFLFKNSSWLFLILPELKSSCTNTWGPTLACPTQQLWGHWEPCNLSKENCQIQMASPWMTKLIFPGQGENKNGIII